MRSFATAQQCRHQSLSEHFGQDYEVPDGGCGACDVCQGSMQPLPKPTWAGHRRGRADAADGRQISRAGQKAAPKADMDAALFDKLRAWRRAVAQERKVPAYVIFHDATLMRIATIRPMTVAELRSISGVGARRAEEYGKPLIDLLAESLT